MQYKTNDVLLHKDALPKDIRKRLGIKQGTHPAIEIDSHEVTLIGSVIILDNLASDSEQANNKTPCTATPRRDSEGC